MAQNPYDGFAPCFIPVGMLRKLIVVSFVVWALQLSAYWISVSFAAIDGHFPSPQPDTELYCQAARRIVEGHPFSYSEGEAVSTGTTSVLYPFVLAMPYVCGATGDRLLSVGFFLNGFFYLIFVLAWTSVVVRCIYGDKAKFLSVALIGLAAQPAISAFGQTDTGLWMAVSALFVAAVAWKRMRLATALMVLGPWVRPEGVILAVAFGLATVCCARQSWRRLIAAGLGLLSSVFVFVFNWCLTGRWQYDSVAHKGYFTTLPLTGAICSTIKDGIAILRTFFVGTTAQWPDSIYFLPILGGVFLAFGVVSRSWRRRVAFPLAVMGIATLGSLAVVASSGWLGKNFDRYLAWTMPVFLVLTAEGAVRAGRIPALRRMPYLPMALCVGFYGVTAVGGVMMLHVTSRKNASVDEFQRACESAMYANDQSMNRSAPGSVGGFACADAYGFSSRRYCHLAGLYSPAFFDYYKIPRAIELLKRRKDLRFDFWDIHGDEIAFAPEQKDEVLGPACVIGPFGNELRQADWRAFDAGEDVRGPADKHLVARLDVGYLPEEKAADYEVVDRWGREPAEVFYVAAPLNGRLAVDGGRSIQGGDMFTLPLVPGRDCEVTMRTLARYGADVMKSPVRMLLQVDGKDVGTVQYDLNLKSNAFQEVSFRIPGAAIKGNPCCVGFLGDHIVCGYWFWQ